MKRILLLSALLSFTAIAQDVPAPPTPAPASSLWAQVAPAITDLVGVALLGALGFLANYLRSKQAESKAARVGLVVTEAATAAARAATT
jgi:hypothetical protein